MTKFYSSDGAFVVIDLPLNIFLHRKKHSTSELKFDQDILLEPHWIDNLEREIVEIQSKNSDAIIGVNMEYIHSFLESRAFIGFAQNIPNKSNVFFYNILPNSDLQMRLYSDLNSSGLNAYFDDKSSIVYLVRPEGDNGAEYINTCMKLVSDRLTQIVEDIITEKEQREMLSSSNVYVNYYVDVKRLFMQTERLNIILYYMTKHLLTRRLEYDALVSTSKNGAVLATLVGQLVDKEVVHCINVGPQYALPAQAVEQAFQRNKRYVYVCDFICLGTEVKLLHALVTSRQAVFAGGVAIASYIPLDNKDLKETHSPLASVSCLVDLISAGIPYEIHINRG